MMVSVSPDHPWLTVNNAALKAAAPEVLPLPQILLPLADIGLRGVATWLESTRDLGPLPSIVARVAVS